jgi:peptidoglycan/LPS O-acetylase OafA/YrhL
MRICWRPRLPPLAVYIGGSAFVLWLYFSPRHFTGGLVGAIIRNTANEWLVRLCALLIVVVASRDLPGGRSLLRSKPLVKLGVWSYAYSLAHATVSKRSSN